MKKALLLVGMLVAVGILYACGGGSSGGSSVGVAAPAVSTPKVIATKEEAAKTASASTTMAASLVKGGGIPDLGSLIGKPAIGSTPNGHRIVDTILGFQKKLSALPQKSLMLGKVVAAATSQNQTIACTDGGDRTITASSNGFSMTANQCKEFGTIENGSVSITGISSSSTDFTGAALVANLTTVDYAAGGYAAPTFESTIKMTMNIVSMSTTGSSMKINLSGSSSEVDYLKKESNKAAFTGFSMDMAESAGYTLTLDGVANMETYSDTTFTKVDTKSGMTFKKLSIVTGITNSGSSVSINGTYAIAAIPACMDGTYVITTASPIITDSTGMTTGGKMTVNGVDMLFNADGSVAATIGGQTQTITAADAKTAASSCQLSFSEGIL